MASSVPRCVMTSTTRPWSCQCMSLGTRIRWPEEEMGRNSVIPCTTARTMICSIVIGPSSPRLFHARAGSIRGPSLARFILQRLAAERVDGDSAALSPLRVFPVDPARARRVRRRGRARRGAALGMAPGIRGAEPCRNAAGASSPTSAGRSSAPMPSRNISATPRTSATAACSSHFRATKRRGPRCGAWSTGSTASSTTR